MTITSPTITRTAPSSPNGFDAAFERLVDARLEYEALRAQEAPIGALIEARAALHRARADMARHRRIDTI